VVLQQQQQQRQGVGSMLLRGSTLGRVQQGQHMRCSGLAPRMSIYLVPPWVWGCGSTTVTQMKMKMTQMRMRMMWQGGWLLLRLMRRTQSLSRMQVGLVGQGLAGMVGQGVVGMGMMVQSDSD
jgi:hypothetical protein